MFHGAPGSWKNVISLGDGPAERRALQERPGAEAHGIPHGIGGSMDGFSWESLNFVTGSSMDITLKY